MEEESLTRARSS